MKIRFFCDGISFHLKAKRAITKLIKNVVADEKKTIDSLCYVFVSDEIILELNQKYLNHNYCTDIITFDYSCGNSISGEMYISVDTVRENAKDYNVDFKTEMLRVILHGALHLCGYKDDSEEEQQEMRKIEDKYLATFDKAIHS